MKNFILLLLIFMVLFYSSSCKKDPVDPGNPNNPNETELVTTVKLVMTDRGNTSNVVEAIFKDADGDGGAAPTVFDTIRLESGKAYDVEILLLDESKNPVDTISHEVEEEGEEHQFFFTASGGADLTFAYSDSDGNGVPIGLLSAWTANAVTTDKNGKVQVVLKHQGEDKPSTPPGDENIGDTDIEVNFPVIIE